MDHWEIPSAEMLLIHGLIPCGNPGQELVGNLLLQIKKMNDKVKPLVTLQEKVHVTAVSGTNIQGSIRMVASVFIFQKKKKAEFKRRGRICAHT